MKFKSHLFKGSFWAILAIAATWIGGHLNAIAPFFPDHYRAAVISVAAALVALGALYQKPPSSNS